MVYKPEYLCDLHCHTLLSDGNDTYKEIIDIASKIGMKVIALTDHDVTPLETMVVDEKEISTVEYGLLRNVHVIPGIEFSCDTYVDDVHIIGLGCNFRLNTFKIEEENMKKSKINSYRKLTELLTEHGINISWGELLENEGNPRNPENIQRKHIFEQIARKGYTPTWQEAKIMVRDNPELNVKREKIDPLRAVEIIHESGGIAILAHPYLIDEIVEKDGVKLSRKEYIDKLIEFGLDGIEAAYTYSKTSYKGTLTQEQIEQKVKSQYGKRVKIISGGSDYHNDAKKSVHHPRMLGEKGMSFEYFINNDYLKTLI